MKQLLLLISMILSTNAYAAFNCSVYVNRVLVYGDGSVNILHSGRNDFTYICNTKGTWKGIDTVTCSLWVGMLQSTQNNARRAIFYYGGEGSCETLPTYGNAPAPVYIGSIK
ncbi:conserved hypothetical protein [Vibrio nigripulchritudo MADA3029]|uniref:hypothetical protein n=1 Tax=Vibrio nigripulchritudo TaxID=28173 RepID=UPI0003B206D9|nr:hypothetical protein [Vibrio nigripulchritudo]CCN45984.1 conserved hypothetical protein [Vibrio nigripulchritudo MADA3020]CCN54108.1 conserved hypothetical protein [Vibrio nigripulchritudo MADA3021]CCN61178.1 conserved hypothetical protein [Vibrio nigripulchritudo MADA3029]